MNKFFIVLFHTYLTKLKSKPFIISTIVTLIFMYGFLNFDRIIMLFEEQEQEEIIILVIDRTDELYKPLGEVLSDINPIIKLENFSGTTARAIELVSEGRAEALIRLDYNQDAAPTAMYQAMTVVEQALPRQLEEALQRIKEERLTARLNLDADVVKAIYEPIQFERIAIDQHAKTENQLNQARVFVYILLFIIYFTVIFFGNMIATEIAIEKSSRVMEILISSSSPIQQMFGKIFGIALLGLTQYALIFLVGIVSLWQRISGQTFDPDVGEIIIGEGLPIHLIGYAFLFFILGFFLYATIAAMLGSLVSRIEDVSQVITPMVLLIVAAFMIAMFGLSQPDSKLITITSFIPFFAPMIMFLRVGMLNLPLWELLLGIGILLASIVLMAWFSAKVYRGGVLIYGKSFSIKDFKKALQLGKRENN